MCKSPPSGAPLFKLQHIFYRKQATQAIGPGIHGHLEIVPTEADACLVFGCAFMRNCLQQWCGGKLYSIGLTTTLMPSASANQS